MKTAASLLLLAALANAANANGSPHVTPIATARTGASHVEIRGARIHAKDLIGGAASDIDLGPTPPIGSSRLIERAEIERAYVNANIAVPKKIPSLVRVSRQTRRLSAVEVGSAIRAAIADKPLARGAALSSVRAAAAEVGGDFHHVTVELPALPRRAGPATLQAMVTFVGEADATIHKTIVPVVVTLPPEAAFAEITRGAPIALVIRRGLIEVSVSGVAAADADIGSVLPVTIKPSGRVLRARAIDKGHAVALEDS